jgi:tetratricopeptide (TPR) repeat protein
MELSSQPSTALPEAPAPAPARPPRRPWAGSDPLGAGLVVLLAFFLGSFPARNSDAWLHLATGRALLQGTYHLGSDPFAYTTDGGAWVNPSWLYDVLGYLLYQAVGGTGLVLLKAALVAVLSGVMLATCWRVPHKWVALLAVALAVVALGPYLALRPACLSMFFLGATIWWLERRAGVPGAGAGPLDLGGTLREAVPLLVLFALWANLDEWFLLGLLAVGLYFVGTLLEEGAAARARGRTLGLVLAAGLLVCLLNPHHVRVFLALPAALGPAPDAVLLSEPAGPDLASSPLARGWAQVLVSLYPGGIAYYLLVLLTLTSLAAGAATRNWPRVLALAAFLALSLWRGAGVPFFAVAAGPLLALSFHEFAVWRARVLALPAGPPPPVPLWGRLATVAVLAALAVTAWPGWLQGFPAEPRRWTLDSDASLELAAQQLTRWRQEGLLGAEARGFNFSPAAANHLAWLCPGQRDFLDGRAHVFPPDVVADFLTVRQALLEPPASPETEPEARQGGWREVLRRRKVTHLIVYDPSEGKLTAVLHKLLADSREFAPVFLRGRTTIYAWHDPAAPDRPAEPAAPVVDLDRRAYHPGDPDRAPATGPGREPEPRTWFDAFDRPRPGPNSDKDESLVYLTSFQARRLPYLKDTQALYEAMLAAGSVGLAAPAAGAPVLPPGTQFRLGLLCIGSDLQKSQRRDRKLTPAEVLAVQLIRGFVVGRDDGPPGSLLLAVRAARRALHAAPDDAITHLLLGEAYLRLMRNTAERTAVATFPQLDQLRKVQCITALKNAARLRPDMVEAHADLVGLYQVMGYYDLALQHLQRQIEITRDAGPRQGKSAEQHAAQLRQLTEAEKTLSRQVRDLLSKVEVQSLDRNVLGRALLAESAGLPGKALDILLASDVASFGGEGALKQLQLLLYTGRVSEFRSFLEPEQEEALRKINYHNTRWLQAEQAAADGDYAAADEHLQAMTLTGVAIPELRLPNLPFRQAMALMISKHLLESTFPNLWPERAEFWGKLAFLAGQQQQQADQLALRGLLALEEGQTERAGRLLGDSLGLRFTGREGGAVLAEHFLQLMARSGGPAGK